MKNIERNLDFSRKFILGKAGCAGVSILIVFGAVYTRPSRARLQQSPDAAPSYEYEVASIKPNKSGTNMVRLMFSPSGLSATNVTLGMLIRRAYGIEENQISGGPSWLNSDHYDIDSPLAIMRNSRARRWTALQPTLFTSSARIKEGLQDSTCCRLSWRIASSWRSTTTRKNLRFTRWSSQKTAPSSTRRNLATPIPTE